MTGGLTQLNNSYISSCCGLNKIAQECPRKSGKWYANVAYYYDYVVVGFTSDFDNS